MPHSAGRGFRRREAASRLFTTTVQDLPPGVDPTADGEWEDERDEELGDDNDRPEPDEVDGGLDGEEEDLGVWS